MYRRYVNLFQEGLTFVELFILNVTSMVSYNVIGVLSKSRQALILDVF